MSKQYTTRRRILQSGAVVGTLALAGCADDEEPDEDPEETEAPTEEPESTDEPTEEETEEPDDEGVTDPTYEFWAFDQGTDRGYVYLGDEDGNLELDAELDVGELADTNGDVVPHMVDFNSTGEYAAVACTAGRRVLVFRAEDRELVGQVETGPGSHFAGFTPDDEYIQVDVIDDEKLVQIDVDLDEETFEYGDELVIAEDSTFAERDDEFDGSAPICHDYDDDGYSYHTLGPSVHNSGVVVVEVDSFSIETVFAPDEIRANCGTIKDPNRDQLYLTAGAPSNDEETGGVGEWYVLDTDAKEPIHPDTNEPVDEDDYAFEDVARDAEGYDTHGFWFADDELFVLNRETHDGIVIDPETNEVTETVDDYGTAPDIFWGTPEDSFLFASLRGPNPVSGDPHASEGETPGFSVFDVESREVVDVIEPDGDDPESDFHGVGGREL